MKSAIVLFVFLGISAWSAEPVPVHVTLKNAQGADVGTAQLTQKSKGVQLQITAKGLPPGLKGIHIHETGKCDPPDFKSAGAHYNPKQTEHGRLNPKGAHLGDLPNLEIQADGRGDLKFMTAGATLRENSLRKAGGTAIVIHAGPDDLSSDPAGGSGDRIACGVISELR